ncbi:LacI family DNA-binding transcriptional regulator [Paenibacillus sp. IB182496]|uniref:LacI family DNA-binding transcriptional regulator n=1 Tax=Paenibacillus sabuli TaxID=2772509 RepID=A0A927BRE5_9BACL|nr:LacI family DNA-binding transcriptional regulator [Paenibacillus sabuli]MBD2845366.1 LacI family DNA-binding transcriptional regulator [Paenibacillus sabuli]
MASIKEIAAAAGVSPATASIVLSGKAEQYRISAATRTKVTEAARQLNYQPNIAARRLRSSGEAARPIIALFWALDARAMLIGRFLKGLQEELRRTEADYELMVQPYEGTKLEQAASLITGTRFNGAIITNLTEQDQAYLEQADIQVPLVLYLRGSRRYSWVNVDSMRAGEAVAQLLAGRGHRRAGLLVPALSSSALEQRRAGFLAAAAQCGMDVPEHSIAAGDYSESGGYEAMLRLLDSADQAPTAVFALSDQMAVGALAALRTRGLQVPQQIELVGHDDDQVASFTEPPLTTVHLPVEEMAQQCLQQLLHVMNHQTQAPLTRMFDSRIVVRGSCGGTDSSR